MHDEENICITWQEGGVIRILDIHKTKHLNWLVEQPPPLATLLWELLSSDALQEAYNSYFLSGEQTGNRRMQFCLHPQVWECVNRSLLVWCDDMLLWMEGFKWLSVLDTGNSEHWLLEQSEATHRRSPQMKCDIILGHLGTQYFPFLRLLEKLLPSLVLLAQVGKLNLEQAIKEKMSSHRCSKAEH